MKKVGTILSAFLILILILASGLYFFGVYYFRDWFCPNTYINGTNVSFQRYSVCDDIINNMLITHNLVIEDNDGSVVFIDGEQIYNYDKTQISKAADIIKRSENPYLWPKYVFSPHYYEFKPVVYLNEDELIELVEDSSIGQRDRFDAKRKAEIVYSKENGYELIDNTQNLLDWNLCLELIKQASVQDLGFINLNDSGVYKSVETTREYTETKELWSKLEKTLDFNMTYKLATGEDIVVDSSVISNFLTLDENGDFVFDENGEAVLDSAKILAYVQELSDTYDNMYKDKKFKTTTGGIVTIPYTRYTTYGSLMNVAAEAEELENIIKSHKSPGEREPIYIRKEDKGSYNNNYGGTYVEVDVAGQHMYYYKDNKLVFDTDVVTGCKANGNMTPDCVCFILNKARNVTLIGPGYESFVYYWMCITGQIGIHDATWRRTFGGDIYLWGGSHGCVNTPINKMSELYDMMEIGTPVIVHHYEPPVEEEEDIEDLEDAEASEDVDAVEKSEDSKVNEDGDKPEGSEDSDKSEEGDESEEAPDGSEGTDDNGSDTETSESEENADTEG